MAVNRDKPDRWKHDIAQSVDMYNAWFIRFAPEAYRTTRVQATQDVEATLRATQDLREISVALLKRNPAVLPTLRMATCPPLAVDRLIGLAGVSGNLVKVMEKEQKLPPRMPLPRLERDLEKIGILIEQMADPDIFVWLQSGRSPSDQERYRAATIVADRLCGAVANPIIRNGISSYRLTLSPAVLPFLKAAFSPSRNTPRRNVPKACGFCRSLYFQPVSARYSGR